MWDNRSPITEGNGTKHREISEMGYIFIRTVLLGVFDNSRVKEIVSFWVNRERIILPKEGTESTFWVSQITEGE